MKTEKEIKERIKEIHQVIQGDSLGDVRSLVNELVGEFHALIWVLEPSENPERTDDVYSLKGGCRK
jgi:hypothetical protein